MNNLDQEPPSQATIGYEAYGLVRAGSPERQRTLHARAWSLVEVYRTPSGMPGTRLSNTTMGSKGWCVQLVPYPPLRLGETLLLMPLSQACRKIGLSGLLGTTVNPEGQAAAVWKLGLDPQKMELFFNLHYFNFQICFDEQASCALHANDGDYAVFAGDEAFIHDALPPQALGMDATRQVVEEVEAHHGPGCMDGILEHYAPFMLD